MNNDISLPRQFIESILGWFQSIVSGFLGIFTGSSDESFLSWIGDTWIGWVCFILIGGAIVNLLIYVIRWRPHWWWLAKRRMVVDDRLVDNYEPNLRRTPSTKVPKREQATAQQASKDKPSKAGERSALKRSPTDNSKKERHGKESDLFAVNQGNAVRPSSEAASESSYPHKTGSIFDADSEDGDLMKLKPKKPKRQ